MDLGMKGKNAIVTGSTKGIGRRIVNLLADEGCNVAICARTQEDVDAAIKEISKKKVKVIGSAMDIMDGEGYKAWLKKMADELGGVDLFVPNVSAGGGTGSEQNWYNNFEADVMGTVRGCETLMPYLEKSKGAVVCISTTAAVETFIAPQSYNALKSAVIAYASQLGQAVAPKGVRVNTVSPGAIYFEGGAWEMIKNAMPALYEGTVAQVPMGRLGNPEEIARAVVFLGSPASSFTTGANLVVDGGLTKRIQF